MIENLESDVPKQSLEAGNTLFTWYQGPAAWYFPRVVVSALLLLY